MDKDKFDFSFDGSESSIESVSGLGRACTCIDSGTTGVGNGSCFSDDICYNVDGFLVSAFQTADAGTRTGSGGEDFSYRLVFIVMCSYVFGVDGRRGCECEGDEGEDCEGCEFHDDKRMWWCKERL